MAIFKKINPVFNCEYNYSDGETITDTKQLALVASSGFYRPVVNRTAYKLVFVGSDTETYTGQTPTFTNTDFTYTDDSIILNVDVSQYKYILGIACLVFVPIHPTNFASQLTAGSESFWYDENSLNALGNYLTINIPQGYESALSATYEITPKYSTQNLTFYDANPNYAGRYYVLLTTYYIRNNDVAAVTQDSFTKASDTILRKQLTKSIQLGGIVCLTGYVIANRQNKTFTISGSLQNCTCNYANGFSYEPNTQLNIRITANDGYYFYGTDYKYYIYDNGSLVSTFTFDISGDNTTLTASLTAYYDITIYANTLVPTYGKIETLSNFIRLYSPTVDELNQLSATTYTDFITALYVVPFNISVVFSDQKNNIIMGATDTNIQAYQLTRWKHSIDLGTITIPYIYNNVYDYKNTQARLFVPYFGLMSLDIKHIINKTLQLIIELNFYNGMGTLIVSNNASEVIYKSDKKLAYNLPYYSHASTADLQVVGDLSLPSLENVYQSFIEITRNTPYPDNGFIGKNVYFYSTINELSGYNEITEVDLSNDIPQEIQSEIRDILSGGVFV